MTRQQNEYKILLKSLEDDLLMRLSSAGDNILSDSALVENLEHTKKTAAEIEIKVAEAKKTSFEIDKAREFYRPAAARYFLKTSGAPYVVRPARPRSYLDFEK